MNATSLERTLQRATGRRIRIVLTNNRARVLTYHRERSQPDVLRLSRIFLRADRQVIRALSAFIRGNNGAKGTLQAYVNREVERLGRLRARRGIPVHTLGNRFNLQAIFDDLNTKYFDGAVNAYITWGRRRTVAAKKSVQLGVYSEADRLIRIHPVLDQQGVPLHVVEKIVFHEMLHHVFARHHTKGTRRCLHSKEFLEHERLYRYYGAAERWIEGNLLKILA